MKKSVKEVMKEIIWKCSMRNMQKQILINIFDQIKDEEKPRYYSEFQYYTCYEKDTII